MHKLFLFRSLIFAPETGLPDGGGAGSTTVSAPAANAEAPKEEKALSIGQRLSAALASKVTMQADLVKFQARITELEAQAAELMQAKARIAELEAQAAEFEQAISASEKEIALAAEQKKTVDQAAQERVATLGFPAAKLPAANEESTPAETLDELRVSMTHAKSATEKQEIMKKIRALR